jgi:cell division protein FtsL
MRVFIIIILSVILMLVITELYFLIKERNQLRANLDNLNRRLQAFLKENTDIQSEIEYFSHPENLEKELKAKFNYKKPNEKMMIIVP